MHETECEERYELPAQRRFQALLHLVKKKKSGYIVWLLFSKSRILINSHVSQSAINSEYPHWQIHCLLRVNASVRQLAFLLHYQHKTCHFNHMVKNCTLSHLILSLWNSISLNAFATLLHIFGPQSKGHFSWSQDLTKTCWDVHMYSKSSALMNTLLCIYKWRCLFL